MVTLDEIFGGIRRGSSVTIHSGEEIDFQPFAFVLNVKKLVGVGGTAANPLFGGNVADAWAHAVADYD